MPEPFKNLPLQVQNPARVIKRALIPHLLSSSIKLILHTNYYSLCGCHYHFTVSLSCTDKTFAFWKKSIKMKSSYTVASSGKYTTVQQSGLKGSDLKHSKVKTSKKPNPKPVCFSFKCLL